MRPKYIVILERAVEDGIERGWRRAHKHNDDPSEAVIKDAIEQAIMAELYDVFEFDEGR